MSFSTLSVRKDAVTLHRKDMLCNKRTITRLSLKLICGLSFIHSFIYSFTHFPFQSYSHSLCMLEPFPAVNRQEAGGRHSSPPLNLGVICFKIICLRTRIKKSLSQPQQLNWKINSGSTPLTKDFSCRRYLQPDVIDLHIKKLPQRPFRWQPNDNPTTSCPSFPVWRLPWLWKKLSVQECHPEQEIRLSTPLHLRKVIKEVYVFRKWSSSFFIQNYTKG